MKSIRFLFEWPIKKFLRQEVNVLNRSRLKMLWYGLILWLFTTTFIIVSLYLHHHPDQANSVLVLYVMLVITLLLTIQNIISWIAMAHITLIGMTTIVWVNIFYFNQEINLVTAQFILLNFIYANYLLDKQGRFIYPIINVIPVVLFSVFESEVKRFAPFNYPPVDNLSYFTAIIHNFAFIFFTQHYFLNTFSQAVEKLQTSRKELGMQVLFQKRLIAGISHDIKSPLKYLAITIRGVFKRAEAENPVWIDDIRDAYKSSFKIYHFTENLLQYADVYLENAKINLSQVNLYQLINEKIEIFSDMARAQQCKVYNNIGPRTQILTSKPALTVIVHNLLENAIKYTSKGGVTFMAWNSGDEFIIRINDTGRGMEPELVAWCNTAIPRDQLKDTFSPQGLGLIIVNQLLRKINGKMFVINIPVAGTSIQLTLPATATQLTNMDKI